MLDASGIEQARSTMAGGAKMSMTEWEGWCTGMVKYTMACGIKEMSMAMVCAS